MTLSGTTVAEPRSAARRVTTRRVGWALTTVFAGIGGRAPRVHRWMGRCYVLACLSRAILAGDVASHRRWMVRSFALTDAAVMLRICVPLALLAGFEFTEVHRVIAWLCWVPNLVVAQLLLRCPPVRPSPTAPSRH